MRQRPTAVALLLLATLSFAACGSDSVTAPPEVEGRFGAYLYRFDSIFFTVEARPGGALSGSGSVTNDTGDTAPFTISGRYPEVTFTLTTSNPAIAYYDGARFRGVFRSPYEIVGSLAFSRSQPQQAITLTFQRVFER